MYDFYMNHLKYVNNWDLVDVSAPGIVGAYLLEHEKHIPTLYQLCLSPVLW